VGGDLGNVARNAVEGTIDGAKVIGVSAEEAAAAGAVETAGEIGEQPSILSPG